MGEDRGNRPLSALERGEQMVPTLMSVIRKRVPGSNQARFHAVVLQGVLDDPRSVVLVHEWGRIGHAGAGTADMVRRARAAGVRVVEPVQEPLPGLFMRKMA